MQREYFQRQRLSHKENGYEREKKQGSLLCFSCVCKVKKKVEFSL